MTIEDAGEHPIPPKKTTAPIEPNRSVFGRQYGQMAITLFLLAVFGLAVLCIGIGLTWFANPPAKSGAITLSSQRIGQSGCHSFWPAV